jgi:hypothetical protein
MWFSQLSSKQLSATCSPFGRARKEREISMNNLKIWKTIKVGTGLRTADDFRKALKQSRNKIGDGASDILGRPAFTVAPEEAEMDLVVVSVAELGFGAGADREYVFSRAQELGLELCPAEVGPQLRLQYLDQPEGDELLIGMKPIRDSYGEYKVFELEQCQNWRWLCGFQGYPDLVWNADSSWVFVRRRK